MLIMIKGVIYRSRIKYSKPLKTQTCKNIDNKKQLNENHVRLFRSMINSKAFKKLSSNEIKIYLNMRMKFFEQEEKELDFPYSKSLGTKVLGLSIKSENSIRRALKNLVKYGFLEQTYISKGGGKTTKLPNRYKFSTRWQSYDKP